MCLLFLPFLREEGIASSTVSGRVGNRIRAVVLTPGTGCLFRGVFAGVGSMAAAEIIEDEPSDRLLERLRDSAAGAVDSGWSTFEPVFRLETLVTLYNVFFGDVCDEDGGEKVRFDERVVDQFDDLGDEAERATGGGGGVCAARPKRCVEERVVFRVGYEWVISYFAPCLGVDGVCTADRSGGVVVMLAGAKGGPRRKCLMGGEYSNTRFLDKQGAPDRAM